MIFSGNIGLSEILYAGGGRTGVKGVVPPLDFFEVHNFFVHYNANVWYFSGVFSTGSDAILNSDS